MAYDAGEKDFSFEIYGNRVTKGDFADSDIKSLEEKIPLMMKNAIESFLEQIRPYGYPHSLTYTSRFDDLHGYYLVKKLVVKLK